jgi:hypothetical protein
LQKEQGGAARDAVASRDLVPGILIPVDAHEDDVLIVIWIA